MEVFSERATNHTKQLIDAASILARAVPGVRSVMVLIDWDEQHNDRENCVWTTGQEGVNESDPDTVIGITSVILSALRMQQKLVKRTATKLAETSGALSTDLRKVQSRYDTQAEKLRQLEWAFGKRLEEHKEEEEIEQFSDVGGGEGEPNRGGDVYGGEQEEEKKADRKAYTSEEDGPSVDSDLRRPT
jgi:hypothetical protein